VSGSSRIVIRGLHARGRHGANPGERDQDQEFVVDLDVVVNLGEGDEMEDTVHYRALADTAREVVRRTSFALIESLAEAIGHQVYGFERVVRVVVTVHKPGAATNLGVDDVAVEAIIAP
jgi:dihydroneopterin aldolase